MKNRDHVCWEVLKWILKCLNGLQKGTLKFIKVDKKDALCFVDVYYA